MVEFGTGYASPMDREYGQFRIAHDTNPSPSNNSTNDVDVGIKDIGFSLGLGPVPNVPSIGAKLRAGAKTAELTFMGAGKGSGQQHTPEYYGKAQRTALSEISKANEVNFTTHASVGIQGLAGMDQQGNFSKASKDFSVQEIKRAIEFAGDVAGGGPVVVHSGEFYRPIVDASWNKDKKFQMYEGEEERASFRVVDTRTGRVIQEAQKNRKVARPIWNTTDKNVKYVDFDGKEKVASSEYDSQGRIIYLDPFGKRISDEERVPKFNRQTGKFDIEQLNWQDLEKEAKQMTMRAKDTWKEWKHADPEKKKQIEEKSYWKRFLSDDITEEKIMVKPEEAYIISTLETNAANSRGWAYSYGGSFGEHVDNIKKLRSAHEFYKKLEDATDEKEREKLKVQINRIRLPVMIPEDSEYPSKIIEQALQEEERHVKQSQEASASQWAQAEESVETIRHVESAEGYALQESYDAYAQAGISAMRQSIKLAKEGKLKKPVAVAMENLFPESYGAHPDELKDLVLGSREKMASRLMKDYSLSSDQARKKADQHITATLDTGHVNMWRKYWITDPKKTIEENDNNFDKWLVGKIGELAKAGVIGHVHLVDNFGYQDDHLAPGEGNSPIQKMVKALKENGYKGELIVEPGADWSTDVTGFHSVMKAWKLFGSPVYGAGSGGGVVSRGWGQVGYGHFGENLPPYFVFGPYSPSEDWTLWSGVPLE